MQRRAAWTETVQARTSFGSAWKPILKVLENFAHACYLFTQPSISPGCLAQHHCAIDVQALLLPILLLPVLLLPRAAFSKSASPVAPPTAQTVEVWPCTHTPHRQTASSISDSTTSPSPISTTAVSHRVSSHHDAPVSSKHDEVVSSSRQHAVTQLDHIVAEHSVAQLAGESYQSVSYQYQHLFVKLFSDLLHNLQLFDFPHALCQLHVKECGSFRQH